jgi:cystathionine gamma-synthase
MAKLSGGDEIVFFDECYHRSREFCLKHLSRFGVTTRVVKTNDYEALADAVTPRTKLLVSESPTNPHLSVVDLERFVAVGKRAGVETLIDATLATPFNLQPLKAGVDYVLHSATKYLGGHNDLLAGVVVGSTAKLESVRNLRGILGTITSPHVCYLLQRGLKTFALRMAQHNRNGLALAEFLASRPEVKRVYYPGLPAHPGHAVAVRTMKGFGGLLTFVLHGDRYRAMKFVDSVRIPKIGPSLGGVESLIEQPLLMSYWNYTPEHRASIGIDDAMIRVAAGIEDADDLVDDFRQAFEQL